MWLLEEDRALSTYKPHCEAVGVSEVVSRAHESSALGFHSILPLGRVGQGYTQVLGPESPESSEI